MKLKRCLLILLSALMLLSSLTACKKGTNDDDEPPVMPAYNDKIKSKVKGVGVGYWKTGDDTNYTIFTLEQQEGYLIDENFLNGEMFFISTDYDKSFNMPVTYNDETVWAFDDLAIKFAVDGDKMTLSFGDKQYTLDRVKVEDISEIRDTVVAELEKEKEEENPSDTPATTPSDNIEITTSSADEGKDKNEPSKQEQPSEGTSSEKPAENKPSENKPSENKPSTNNNPSQKPNDSGEDTIKIINKNG